MQNELVIEFTRNQIKEGLELCTEPQIMVFKRIYSHKDLELPIDKVVDRMEVSKLENALSQVERTVVNNSKLKKDIKL